MNRGISQSLRMRIGIFFGGQSREREISFAGGRTVYDNLDKELFEAIPIFVDSLGNFIELDWQYIYKGTIRDFYPPFKFVPESQNGFQIYAESLKNLDQKKQIDIISEVGKKLEPTELKSKIDFAFLALHGPYGEDGNIQGLLEWYNIPYSGSGILPSAIGINKSIQKDFMRESGFQGPKSTFIEKQDWKNTKRSSVFETTKAEIGLPMVIKSPYQGSSIGITILKENDFQAFERAVNKSFFIEEIKIDDWNSKTTSDKIEFIRVLVDIREGIGMPLMANGNILYHPEGLLKLLDTTSESTVVLESLDNEEKILIESFIEGEEFSCIVVQDENGKSLALPPTQILKNTEFFDYRSKYLPGMSRKITPIDLPIESINSIRIKCEELFEKLHFNVYARIDGFITLSGEIFLNDPNTTSGMMPSSFFFHQAAEIGLNPSQFLTFIVRTSLSERIKTGKKTHDLKTLLSTLDQNIKSAQASTTSKRKAAVIMGGFSSERHISVESGRNIYEKLSSSDKYDAIPVFLSGDLENHVFHVLPVNVMLKDNADDIRDKVYSTEDKHPVIQEICELAQGITKKYAGNPIDKPQQISYADLAEMVDCVFIALHGRPGEDGKIQKNLDQFNIPYNGSGVESSQVTINKYETNEILKNDGIPVAEHVLISKDDWRKDKAGTLEQLLSDFKLPLIGKPADDGCSSAVKKIDSKEELTAFVDQMLRDSQSLLPQESVVLQLSENEEFPQKEHVLIEELINQKDTKYFLEVTGGMLTSYDENGDIQYEIFEPSEALASGDILSLEEKFLAGEGQNITPARYSPNEEESKRISAVVRKDLERVARKLNVQGYCRIDAFVKVKDDDSIETYIIEINSLPGMTPATCIFHQCAINGYKPYEFIDAILEFGQKRVELKK